MDIIVQEYRLARDRRKPDLEEAKALLDEPDGVVDG
jgi:hypothetical protein